MDNNQPEYLTQMQLSELLQIPVRTIEDWRHNKKGPPFVTLGRHVRYDLVDVKAWVKSRG
ncbi:helix-turn-helix domain-containing protein [Leifsonia kafniensis]|uniref:Helix-turn-helix domain-containing protein n=1 Tax=Leifsonia kafniensis TaxID=475957 RepID=A0ABP7KAT1_9MICO